ncbi:MAG: hypothetical protein V7L30_33185 [Nostoc sp.]|uniref:hypothetical protein n=1 Tax=Nostoc sp. TaxID=1180 RepID=UPI002FF758BB
MSRSTAKSTELSLIVSQALVRYSSKELAPIIEELGGKQPSILPGYRIKIIDGNNLAATEHRLSVLRDVSGGPLPGKSCFGA